MSALIIYNVDLDKLEEQRKLLTKVLFKPAVMALLTGEELAMIKSIEHMLNSWSDERAADSREVAT